MKTCLIRQPAGLGDIFFTQKIAKTVLKKKLADKIIWPVIKEYGYISNYLITPQIQYIVETEKFLYKQTYENSNPKILNTSELLYIPLQHADQTIKNCPIMQTKYKFCGNIDYKDWKNYFEFKRNIYREQELIKSLNINNEPFNLINCNYGSKNLKNLNCRREIKVNNNYKNIYMEYKENDNIFDWIGVFEMAKEIHTVDTVLCYLLEKMNMKNVILYSRTTDTNFFKYTDDIFNVDWKRIL